MTGRERLLCVADACKLTRGLYLDHRTSGPRPDIQGRPHMASETAGVAPRPPHTAVRAYGGVHD